MSDDDLIRRGGAREAVAGAVDYSHAQERIAALPAVQPVVKVKPLVWRLVEAPTSWWTAQGIGGNYVITWEFGRRGQCLTYPGNNGMQREWFKDETKAKAAAFAHYERASLAALDVQPAPEVEALVAENARLRAGLEGLEAYIRGEPSQPPVTDKARTKLGDFLAAMEKDKTILDDFLAAAEGRRDG
jgi:hypothetical protein